MADKLEVREPMTHKIDNQITNLLAKGNSVLQSLKRINEKLLSTEDSSDENEGMLKDGLGWLKEKNFQLDLLGAIVDKLNRETGRLFMEVDAEGIGQEIKIDDRTKYHKN